MGLASPDMILRVGRWATRVLWSKLHIWTYPVGYSPIISPRVRQGLNSGWLVVLPSFRWKSLNELLKA